MNKTHIINISLVLIYYSQYDSDGDEIVGSDNEDDEYNGYKVWYSASCDIAPAPPERNISIKCNCQVCGIPSSLMCLCRLTFKKLG